MKREQRKLLLHQIEKKVSVFSAIRTSSMPNTGWIYAIRNALGMSMRQLGKKLDITPQGVKDIERREEDGSITLNSLRETAAALDMQLVYGFVPKKGTLTLTLEDKAKQVATMLVMRASHTMLLEDQALSKEELQRAIEDKTQELITEMPRYIWD